MNSQRRNTHSFDLSPSPRSAFLSFVIIFESELCCLLRLHRTGRREMDCWLGFSELRARKAERERERASRGEERERGTRSAREKGEDGSWSGGPVFALTISWRVFIQCGQRRKSANCRPANPGWRGPGLAYWRPTSCKDGAWTNTGRGGRASAREWRDSARPPSFMFAFRREGKLEAFSMPSARVVS